MPEQCWESRGPWEALGGSFWEGWHRVRGSHVVQVQNDSEGVAETKHCGLIAVSIPHLPAALGGEEVGEGG